MWFALKIFILICFSSIALEAREDPRFRRLKDRVVSTYRNCSNWIKNSPHVTDEDREEVNRLLREEKFSEYRDYILMLAEAEANKERLINDTRNCFRKISVVEEGFEHLRRSKHKSVLEATAHETAHKKIHGIDFDVNKYLTRGQLKKLHKYLLETGDSGTVVRKLNAYFRHMTPAVRARLIDQVLQYSPSPRTRANLATTEVRQRSRRSVEPNILFDRRFHPNKLHTLPLRKSPIHEFGSEDLPPLESILLNDENKISRNRRATLDVKRFNWLSPNQSAVLIALKDNAADIKLILEQAYEYFLLTDGGLREKALKNFQGICGKLASDIMGSEQFAVLKAMYDNGKSGFEINAKLNEILTVLDEDEKKEYSRAAPVCKQLFGIHDGEIRKGRKLFLESKHLNWLSSEQVMQSPSSTN